MTHDQPLTVSHLTEPAAPWILGLSSDASDPVEMEFTLGGYAITARTLNGARMRTDDGLFNEFASRLEFPDYFGENWDALDECLADLSWLSGFAYIVVIAQARYLLDREPSKKIETFRRLIEHVSGEWAAPVNLGEFWDRPAIPFHLILHESPDQFPALQARLHLLNIDLPTLSWNIGHDRL